MKNNIRGRGVEEMYTKEKIKELIVTSDKAVERGLVAIFNLQTFDERKSEETREKNGVGFSAFDAPIGSAFDAPIGSYYAKWIKSGKHLNGRHLIKARKLILKYIGQLTKIANKKITYYSN